VSRHIESASDCPMDNASYCTMSSAMRARMASRSSAVTSSIGQPRASQVTRYRSSISATSLPPSHHSSMDYLDQPFDAVALRFTAHAHARTRAVAQPRDKAALRQRALDHIAHMSCGMSRCFGQSIRSSESLARTTSMRSCLPEPLEKTNCMHGSYRRVAPHDSSRLGEKSRSDHHAARHSHASTRAITTFSPRPRGIGDSA